MPVALVPEDDLYARLELSVDASPEAIELAWRALLKRHHPDVAGAGEGTLALERAKRINVAHDWLSDPDLRARYDRERLGILLPAGHGRVGVRHGRNPRAGLHRRPSGPGGTGGPRRVPRWPDLVRGSPTERFARFLDGVSRLTQGELDRLAAAEPPPIAFLATIRRFVPPEARATFEAAETELSSRVPHERWAEAGLREGLLGVAAELLLAGFLDETLDEPFRSRARERLLRAWQASVEQPRLGPNGEQVVAMAKRVAGLQPSEIAAFIRASRGIPGDDRPWPGALDREEDEALRISAVLAARDVAGALSVHGLAPTTATRARRLAARLGHVVALRHAYSPTRYAELMAPWLSVVGVSPDGARPSVGPDVRRAG